MQDVIIENVGATEATVIAGMPVARGEHMLLHIEDDGGGGTSIVVQGFERRPVVVDGQLCHRLRLNVIQSQKGESA